jgi:hypothetical protein
MVRDRTAEMVWLTMMLKGVSLFLLCNVGTTSCRLSLVSTLASNTGKASSKIGSSDDLARILCEIEEKYLSRVLILTRVLMVGFLVGFLLVTLDLGKRNAFPAVKVIGLFLTINPFYSY